MKFYTLLIVLICLSGINSLVYSQQTRGNKIQSSDVVKVNYAEIVKYEEETGKNLVRKEKTFNKEKEKPVFKVDPAKIIYSAPYLEKSQGSKDPSPLPEVTFQGLEDNNNSIPPDVNGAVGPDHLMITLNTGVRIMDKNGVPISTTGLGSFWFPMPGSGETFDPKIQYDPYANRWMLVTPSSSSTSTSAVFVGVSATSDPTGDWYFYSIDSDPDNQNWFDYPSYGYNKNWIVISGNMFGNGLYNVLFIVDKNQAYAGAENLGVTRMEVDDFTLVPSVTLDPDAEDIYLVSNGGGNSNGMGYLRMYNLSGETGNEVLNFIGYTGIPYPWESWVGNSGNFAPQLGSDERINSGDARIQNVIYRHGKIWCAHHVFLPVDEPTRSAIQWFELDPDGTILQYGRVDDESGYYHYTFPTIAVNAKEDIMIGYCSFSPGQYASSSYSFRYAGDPPNILRDRYQFKDGLAPYFKNYGADRNRWGDYTATVIDPVNDLDFWTLQEYADLPAGGYDRWGTWWAKINVDAEPVTDFSSNITTVPVTTGVDFTDLTKFEPETWHWIFEGGTPAESNEQNPQNIIYNTPGSYDVTLVTTNYLGTDTLIKNDFIVASTTILPAVSFSVNDTLPCTGETVSFTDETIYNPGSWNWNIEPNTVTFVEGTQASSQHPKVKFDEAGNYTVSLTAANPNGNATLVKENLVTAGGLVLPFSEDFESAVFSTKSWNVLNPDEDKTWKITGIEGNGSNFAAFLNFKNYSHFGERDRLISPPINLLNYTQAYLTFDHAYAQRYPQYTDSLLVYISEDCGSTWARLISAGEDGSGNFASTSPSSLEFFPLTTDDWCDESVLPHCFSVDLSSYTGKSNLYFMFETYNGFGNNLFIDNIQVYSPDVVSDLADNSTFSIFPNPTTGVISLIFRQESANCTIELLSSQGKLINTIRPGNTRPGIPVSIDLKNEVPGLYFIRVIGDNEVSFGKVVRE